MNDQAEYFTDPTSTSPAGSAAGLVVRVTASRFKGNGFGDGIDVDESGDGSLIGRLVQVSANDNAEEGFDLNENDAGDLRIETNRVEASRNVEEGMDFEEDETSSAVATCW